MPETVSKSNLKDLKKGSLVHLERALTLQSRLGGHMVSGHIDGTGEIKAITKDENATWLTIAASEDLLKYIIYKGSIAIDGVSLTIAQLGDEDFKVSLIPHTGSYTHLLHKKIGETVNLECDAVGKYVERLMKFHTKEKPRKSALTKDFLAKYDFL
ncbi:riboflavin synthase [Cellulosilyticum ruminicola]|nr:riboflavin synthase [Cellulosilyticum ruminicola]